MIGSKGATLVALAAALVASTNAACHQNCNGHGTCGQYDRCTCYHGWDHVNAEDCSQRVCPYGQAWASISENVHKYAECSNQGNCNRETGECECNEGFTGHSCQRSSCPNSCSGHGQCQTLKTWETTYSAWDADKIMACKCDPGYDSADCSTRKCPLGDDPLSTEDTNSQQVITFGGTTAVGNEFALKFTDWTGQVHTTHRIKLVASCESNAHLVQEALVAIPNNVVPMVEVTGTVGGVVDGTSTTCALTVVFTANENTGDVEELGIELGSDDAGAQPLISTPLAVLPVIVVTRGNEESKVCSGRGICNSELGLCQCHVGFYGHSCDKQTALQ